MLRVLVIVALLLAAAPVRAQSGEKCGPLPAAIEGQAWAIDGDTLAMLEDGRRTPDIRLFGIQAPELREKASGLESREGMRSRALLDDLLAAGDNRLRCAAIEWDRYCRVVARCALSDQRDVSTAMLLEGGAYVFTTYALRAPHGREIAGLLAAERAARKARRGLWREWLAHHD